MVPAGAGLGLRPLLCPVPGVHDAGVPGAAVLPSSRYVLSIVSMVTFVVSKIAVGIFAGGVVFSTLLPEIHLHVGGIEINSFWIGSVAVIVLTGLYTALGGMRAVAYNDAVQVSSSSAARRPLTFYGLFKLGGWHELRVSAVPTCSTSGSR